MQVGADLGARGGGEAASQQTERGSGACLVRNSQHLASAHAAISLSSCESFGIPVVGAMRAGLPAVVADEPWSRELVGDAAMRVDGSVGESVASGIRALETEDGWARRAEAGRRVAARYTWAANAASIVKVARSPVTLRGLHASRFTAR
jgi:glycosyltransferase involved in cell wall biosynthesis